MKSFKDLIASRYPTQLVKYDQKKVLHRDALRSLVFDFLDIETEDLHRALVRDQQGGEHADQRGLAGAVRAEDAEDFAALYGEGDIGDRVDDLRFAAPEEGPLHEDLGDVLHPGRRHATRDQGRLACDVALFQCRNHLAIFPFSECGSYRSSHPRPIPSGQKRTAGER